jgi:membrane protease YdiL (CAAX protease family)
VSITDYQLPITNSASVSRIVFTFITVIAAVLAFRATASVHWAVLELGLAEGLLKILLWVVPSVGAIMAADRVSLHEGWRALGLDSDSRLAGYSVGLLATLPMAVVVLFFALGRLDSDELVGSVVLGPFAEEVLFRGFLFRRLILDARWSPQAAIVASAALFGLAHLGTPGQGFFDLLILGAGGVAFAWICYRWDSLWPAIGLHSFINFWWVLCDSGPQSSARLVSVGHLLSIAVALIMTRRPRSDIGNW